MTARLATIAPDVVDRLDRMSPELLRYVAVEVSRWAIDRVGVIDPRVDDAFAKLQLLRFGDSAERDSIEGLVAELDDKAWDLQDAADAGMATEQEYLAAFSCARAASAVWFALSDDTGQDVAEAVYEAHAAVGDLGEIRRLIRQLSSQEWPDQSPPTC